MNKTTKIFSNINGDLFGGITAGIVALPLALAFGEQTELGAIAGLYGAIALGILAVIFGGTKTQISGPTAPMTVVAAVMISEAIHNTGSIQSAMPIIIATFILTGLIQTLLGIFKLGRYIKYIPYPVISGFMSGIGVIIIITQLFPFFGADSPSGGAFGTITNIHKIPEIVNIYSVSIAIATITIIYLFPKFTKKIPASLIALLLISIITYFFIPNDLIMKINSNGDIPTGLPKINLSFLSVFNNPKSILHIIEFAFTLAALGAIDSLLTSVVADNITKTKHNSNKELIGQGIGNMFAGLIGGLPGAGATMRTVININSGGRTQLSGVFAGLFLTTLLLGLGQLVGHIPNAVLAGILITVGIGIIDYKSIKHIKSIPRTDAVIMIIVLFLTVFVDLLVAVAAGMVLSSFIFMIKASEIVEGQSSVKSLKELHNEDAWDDEKDIIDNIGNEVYIKHINGPLFFGMVSGFQNIIKSIPPNIKTVIIRMDKVPYVDQSGLYAMEEAILELKKKNIKVLLVGIYGQTKTRFEKIDIIPGLISKANCFKKTSDIEKYYFKDKKISIHKTVKKSEHLRIITPEIAIDMLKKGNKRFLSSKMIERDHDWHIKETVDAQHPFAMILGCIDSRVMASIIFDQGIGDLFIARIGGNIVNKDILGSMEYACSYTGSKLIVVLGHTSCGAVKGAVDNIKLGNLTSSLQHIRLAIDKIDYNKDKTSDNLEFVNKVAAKNVELTINDIKNQSPILLEMLNKKQINIIGAMYNHATGEVTFME